MNQITVPQFIDSEDKILGPITVRQFVIMLAAAIILFIVYKLSDFSFFVLSAVLIGGCAVILAFLRVNGQPFHFFLLHIIQTVKNPSLRIWKKDLQKRAVQEIDDEVIEEAPPLVRPRIGEQRLAALALVVDTGGAYHEEKESGTELF